jgi:hypothetical protein
MNKEIFTIEFLMVSGTQLAYDIKNYMIKVTFADTNSLNKWTDAVVDLGDQSIYFLVDQYNTYVPNKLKQYLIK